MSEPRSEFDKFATEVAGNCSVSGAAAKWSQSYIGLISMAILSSAEKRLVLSDIYKILTDWLPDRYNASTTAWRNSIRHNLSLNECFVKAGRSANGKGNYWTIHPACIESFARGDYRRRHARRRAVASVTLPAAETASVKGSVSRASSSDDMSEYCTMNQVTVFSGPNVERLSVEQMVSLIPLTTNLTSTITSNENELH